MKFGITLTNDQAAGPPVGSVEVITSALSVTAAQAVDQRAGGGADREPAPRRHRLPGRGAAGRRGRGDHLAGVAGHAERRRRAGDAVQFSGPGGLPGDVPGAGAAGRFGRAEDVAAERHGDAERGARAGDPAQVEGLVEFGDRPGRDAPGRFGRGDDPPVLADRDAERRRRAGDPVHVGRVEAQPRFGPRLGRAGRVGASRRSGPGGRRRRRSRWSGRRRPGSRCRDRSSR